MTRDDRTASPGWTGHACHRGHLALLPVIVIGATLAAAACDHALPGRRGSGQTSDAWIRVDQVGYTPTETKIAMLLSPRDATGASATVIDGHGTTVLTAAVGQNRGPWNTGFPKVHPLNLTNLTSTGTYRIRVTGPVTAQSPPFRVGPAASLFGPLLKGAVGYFQAHRDGQNQIPGPWQRQPAHLDDRNADVYEPPVYTADGTMTEAMRPTEGQIDVEGGWYDAGDFLKFTHTTAYALIAMLLVQRDSPADQGLAAETRHGIDWLDKMWDERTGTLHTQVGIGSGLETDHGTGFLGDHDTWRLPQVDDTLNVAPGDERYYQRYRPVFRAADPGDRLSPNLAGRVAAAFALAAQTEAATDPDRARQHLAAAAQVFTLAETFDLTDHVTDGARELVTAQPRSFYPEESWADDLAAGGTELAMAATRLGDPRAETWARQATHWAKINADTADGEGTTGVVSVYNLSAVADAELATVLTTTQVSGTEINTEGLLHDLRTRLDAGVSAAAADPMGAAAGTGGSDYAARQLGYAATAMLYHRMSGDHRYSAFATAQRAVTLGANGWGTSLIIGAGTTYPRCPHDQIINLTTHAGQATPVMTGAVVNGPNTAARFADLPQSTTKSSCSNANAGSGANTRDMFRAFDRTDARYTDDVRSSASSEPSIDFTATGMLALALALATEEP